MQAERSLVSTLQKYSDTSVEGFGYAIPMSDAMPIVEQLIEKGQVDQSRLRSSAFRDRIFLPVLPVLITCRRGYYVYQVVSDHRQKKQDFVRGDIITEFDGQTITGMTQLKTADHLPQIRG